MTAPGKECHILPCSIAFTGKAPVDVYFQEVNHNGVKAAQFRGRGLFAPQSIAVDGRLLAVDGEHVKLVDQFASLTEWYHEHDPKVAARKTSQGRLAQQWLELAAALHAPVSEESSQG